MTLRYSDVFIAGGFPIYTYYPRSTLKLEEKIGEAKNNLCKLVVVTGHTKSGKTVLVQKMFPREDSIWIDGGTVRSEDEFWEFIVDQLSLFQTIESGETEGTDSSVHGSSTVEGSIIVAKGGASVGGTVTGKNESSKKASRTVSSKVVALEGLRDTKRPVVIDDFHYLPKELQGDLVRALKPLVFAGVPVVIIAIPHRRYDAVKVEREMGARVLQVEIPLWEKSELQFIPNHGSDLLGVKMSKDAIEKITGESIGSPHLTQEFCRAVFRGRNMEATGSDLTVSDSEMKAILTDTAETIGRPIFEKLAKGPRSRSDRKPRTLKSGLQVDIYGLVLHALSHLKPGLVTLEYEELRSSIKEICELSDVPNIQEVARVLKYMSDIAATDQSSTPVINFDEDEKRLHITDPFFAFYLRWGNLAK